MTDAGSEPKSLLPCLQPFYDWVMPWSWPLVRFAAGWNLAVHGWRRLLRGPTGMAKAFADLGFHDPRNFILLLTLAVALRGGGPYSLDRKIGWQL